MDEIQLTSPSDSDVVSIKPTHNGVIKAQTFRIDEFMEALKRVCEGIGVSRPWFQEGVPCDFLSPASGGWRKGKLRFRLEFVPDKPADNHDESLDALRKQLGTDQ